jgi:23S rRNA (guanosine2251-2'-O)-methyltransferase
VILYGRNAVREALRGRRAHSAQQAWATAKAAGEPWLAGTRVRTASAEEIEQRCGSPEHQGVCLEIGGYPYVHAGELLRDADDLIVALDQIQDPQNLGALCRTAECAGAAGVVIPERRAAEVTPAVCKASAGAVEHLPVARVRNVADFLQEAKQAGRWCYGASAEARVGYDQPDYRGGVVLVMGGEGKGLRPRVAAACDELISLPLRGQIESLNVSAAGAVLMYAILQGKLALDSGS